MKNQTNFIFLDKQAKGDNDRKNEVLFTFR